MTKKKFAELELSLLHLQQNVEIPETHLIIHPLIQRAVEQVIVHRVVFTGSIEEYPVKKSTKLYPFCVWCTADNIRPLGSCCRRAAKHFQPPS